MNCNFTHGFSQGDVLSPPSGCHRIHTDLKESTMNSHSAIQSVCLNKKDLAKICMVLVSWQSSRRTWKGEEKGFTDIKYLQNTFRIILSWRREFLFNSPEGLQHNNPSTCNHSKVKGGKSWSYGITLKLSTGSTEHTTSLINEAEQIANGETDK